MRHGVVRARGMVARKAACSAPSLIASTVMVGVLVLPALPAAAMVVLGWAGLAVLGLLVAGRCEAWAVRLVAGGRWPNVSEQRELAPVMAELRAYGFGPASIDVFVSRRSGEPSAIARGRRSVVVAPELVDGAVSGRLPRSEAVAAIAHAAAVSRAGLSRQDLAILYWTAPWRALCRIGWPLRGLFAAAWQLRPLVLLVAVWQSLTTAPQPYGLAAAFVTAALTIYSYLAPRWARSWLEYVAQTGDACVAERGLAGPLIAFLRRYPSSVALAQRINGLQEHAAESRSRPHLRLISDTS
ncbi:MAG: hypothetical protein M1337_00140 [Actinobacteria bacterium]|nr:hypothetical protein [Actinomycetota bacterium]